MHEKMSEDALQALKIAFSYMPRAIEVTKFDYGEAYDKVLEDIETVREQLLLNEVDPDEVYGDVHPGSTPNSMY